VSGEWTISWIWWVTAVEIPAFGCLFWMIHHSRREAERALLKVYSEVQGNLCMVLENLAQSKLEVARLYATIADLKEVEKRLTDHLMRLDTRIAYALSGQDGAQSRWSGTRSPECAEEQFRDHDHGR